MMTQDQEDIYKKINDINTRDKYWTVVACQKESIFNKGDYWKTLKTSNPIYLFDVAKKLHSEWTKIYPIVYVLENVVSSKFIITSVERS